MANTYGTHSSSPTHQALVHILSPRSNQASGSHHVGMSWQKRHRCDWIGNVPASPLPERPSCESHHIVTSGIPHCNCVFEQSQRCKWTLCNQYALHTQYWFVLTFAYVLHVKDLVCRQNHYKEQYIWESASGGSFHRARQTVRSGSSNTPPPVRSQGPTVVPCGPRALNPSHPLT